MDDYFDDFDEGCFMDGDDFEDRFDENFDPEDCFEGDSATGNGLNEADSQEDHFSAFFIGAAIGFGYEEGLLEAERRRIEKKLQGDKD